MRFLRVKDVATKFGVNPRTVYRWVKCGKFPKSHEIPNTSTVVWLESEVEAWMLSITERIKGETASE